MNAFSFMKIFVLICVTVISFSYVLDKESSEKFVFLFSKQLDADFVKQLEKFNWNKLYKITPTTYVFHFNGRNVTESIFLLKRNFKDIILQIDTVKLYVGTSALHSTYLNRQQTESQFQRQSYTNLVCDRYYGMGIEDAWSRGYTGRNVVIAVTDVGINTELVDLQPNIVDDLCFNFVNNSTDVTPEDFPSYREIALTDHGNRCASLIAAVKGNNFCSAGIAYNASIAGLKMFKVHKSSGYLHVSSSSEWMARSHVHKLETIDIYSNSWGPDEPFSKVNCDQKEAIKTSAKRGRRGLGALQIFPVGHWPGNWLANNEYTITVSAVGKNGTISSDAIISSSVLTSGLRNGNNLTADFMVTTSFKDKCINSFAGVSAATAQVAGMLALSLEANKNLTLADVQDIIVYSSQLNFTKCNVSTNAAGLRFHSVFGFGLLNASMLVSMAEEMTEGLILSSKVLDRINICYDEDKGYTAEFCYRCNERSDNTSGCLIAVKTAKIKIFFRTFPAKIRMTLISSSGTVSVLQDFDMKNINNDSPEREQILTSVHFWDEKALGLWRLNLQTADGKPDVTDKVSLTIIGIATDPTTINSMISVSNCTSECSANIDVPGHSNGASINVFDHSNASSIAISIVVVVVIVIVVVCAFKKIKKVVVKQIREIIMNIKSSFL